MRPGDPLRACSTRCALALAILVPHGAAQTQYDPAWSAVPPLQTLQLDYDTTQSSGWNGNRFEMVVESLTPGTRLEVGSGTYTVDGLLQIDLVGTAATPIWIVAQAGASPVLTCSNLNQNLVNLGKSSPARYVVLQGFELDGGDTGLKLWDCENIWIDQCYVHDTNRNAIEANSHDTAWLYITRNEVHGTGGNGEGMYLGANNGAVLTHDSIVALNYVHDTGGSQGDGIELKQGSYGNWIVGNTVHDTNYPCILVYGTDGQAFNVVERNTVYNSNDNTMQVQGEAIVRNNLIMNGNLLAFSSSDHQGTVGNIAVLHNTIINSQRAVKLSDWDSKPNVIFANNAVYSELAEAVYVAGGSTGVVFTGNVTYGAVVGIGGLLTPGVGLSDFQNVTWNATLRDARPTSTGALPSTGNPAWAAIDDITGELRTAPLEAGCYDEDNAAAVAYCTAGTSASGCQASLSASGTPSAAASSGFVLGAATVEGLKSGMFFYGLNGPQANAWGNGSSFQCVVPPVQRAGVMAGTGTLGACDGSFSQDLSAYWAANPQQAPAEGETVQAQLWYRDPLNTSSQTTSLSDALEFTMLP